MNVRDKVELGSLVSKVMLCGLCIQGLKLRALHMWGTCSPVLGSSYLWPQITVNFFFKGVESFQAVFKWLGDHSQWYSGATPGDIKGWYSVQGCKPDGLMLEPCSAEGPGGVRWGGVCSVKGSDASHESHAPAPLEITQRSLEILGDSWSSLFWLCLALLKSRLLVTVLWESLNWIWELISNDTSTCGEWCWYQHPKSVILFA